MATAEHSTELVARDQLVNLTNQVGADSCQQYVRNYVYLWEDRFDRLCRAVIIADEDAAMDVILSIKISSQMAGAERLAALAQSAQQLLSLSGVTELPSMLAVLAVCGRETMTCLLAVLD